MLLYTKLRILNISQGECSVILFLNLHLSTLFSWITYYIFGNKYYIFGKIKAPKQLGKERGVLSESTLAGSKFYFCVWEERRKGQEWGKCCKVTLYGGWVREAKVKLGLSKIKLPEMCYHYHCHQQTQDYVELFIKLATFLSFF